MPQLQFIDSMVDFPVASQRQGSQCKLCKRRRFARCRSWFGWDLPVVVQRQAWMVQTVQSGGAADAVLAVLDAFGGSEGVFGALCAIFRAPLAVPELSASFRSWEPSMMKSSSSSRAWGVALTPGVGLQGPLQDLARVDRHMCQSRHLQNNNNNNNNNKPPHVKELPFPCFV